MRWPIFLPLFLLWLPFFAGADCEKILLEADHSSAIVLVAGVMYPFDRIHAQIAAGLPEGFRVETLVNSRMGWVRDWFPLITQDAWGQYALIKFKYSYAPSGPYLNLLRRRAERAQIPYRTVEVQLALGNVLTTESGHIFISKSRDFLRANSHLSEAEITKRIEEGTGLKVVWMPELPGEATGHIDVFAAYLGKKTFVISDSRDPLRKKALDEAAAIAQNLGYTVHRVMNAGDDDHRYYDALSYTNLLSAGPRVLVPMYSTYRARGHKPVARALYWARDIVQNLVRGAPFRGPWRNDDELIAADDAKARALYESLGYEVVPIKMNDVVALNGMVHCVTACMPEPLYDKLFPERLDKLKRAD